MPNYATTPGQIPPRRRHALLAELAPGVWHPEAVGKVRGYPRTPEVYAARLETLRDNSRRAREAGRLTRIGVPNGWRSQKEALAASRRTAEAKAERMADAMLPKPDGWEEEIADVALRFALSIAMDPTQHPATQLQASRLFLTFTMPRPTVKRAVAVAGSATAFIEQLARQAEAVCEADTQDSAAADNEEKSQGTESV